MAKIKGKTTERTTEQQQPQRVAFLGASGSGKTTAAKRLTDGLKRVVFFDPLAEYTYKTVGITDMAQLKRYIINHYSTGFRVSYVPSFGGEEGELDELSKFLVHCQAGYGKIHNAQMTLLVDELDMSFRSGITLKSPQNGFAMLCKRGRHYGINLVGCSQRTAQIDVCFRGNLSAVYLFRHSDSIDFERARQLIGREFLEDFRQLDNFEYIYKSGQNQRVIKNMQKK